MRQEIPIACSLSAEDQTQRAGEFAAVAAKVTGRESTADGVRLRFPSEPGFAERLADLTAREKECCPFFDFRITTIDGEVVLDVGAPPDARPIVERLFPVEAA
jgi:MerR family transcriptional regulator, copper efflux regulator